MASARTPQLALFAMSVCVMMGVSAAYPAQIHLAFTDKPDEMMVSWATPDSTSSVVQYGFAPNSLTSSSTGTERDYDLLTYKSPQLHHAVMSGLPAQTDVYYRVGNGTSWSEVYSFTTPKPANKPQRFALIADHGHTENSMQTLDRILASHQEDPFSSLFLAGDISYADGWQPTWDSYMNMIQPLSTVLPWMVIVGNHEYVSVPILGVLPNLLAYDQRFDMPRPNVLPPYPSPYKYNTSLYYSVDVGPIHLIALNSENTSDFHPDGYQYQWLEQDLAAADANRANVPWIVCMWHRPWYSTDHTHGNDTTMRDAMEPLLLKYKVNLAHNGHVHAYERTYPVAHGTLAPEGTHGIVYLTNGHAGNSEGLYGHFVEPKPEISAFRLAEFGHSQLTVYNATHMHMQMILNSNGTAIDEAWITRAV